MVHIKPISTIIQYSSIFLLLFLISSKIFSQSIFTNYITGNNPSSINPFINGQIVNSNLSVSGIGFGSGLIANVGDDRYNLKAWSTGAFSAIDYIEFSLTPTANFKINFTSFSYTGSLSANGPANLVLRSSLDNYSSNIATLNPVSGNINLSSATFQNITSSITFRIYGYNALTATGTFSINDFTFNGNVTPTSPSIPVITSVLTASSIVNIPASSYFITANNFPASYNATNLPPGLSINTSTGKISGTPTFGIGSPYNVNISATNAAGTGYATLVYTIPLQTCSTVGVVKWDFESISPSSNTCTNLTVSNISRQNNNGTTALLTNAVPSSGYSNSTGNNNVGAATINGGLSTANSTYFEFTLTPATNYYSKLNGLQFGCKSTTTGPVNYSIRSSLDNYTTDIASSTLLNNSNWTLISTSLTSTQSGSGIGITYRIYAYNGTGAASNTAVWRIDDLQLQVEMIRVPPIKYAINSSANTFCAGGNGVTIGLSGSQLGVNYQLILNGNLNIGNAVSGTGSAFNFGLQSQAGIYSVNAVFDNTTCFSEMTNPVTLSINTINLWTGINGTSWNDVANWSCGFLPNEMTTEIIIPSSAPNQPSLNSDIIIYGNLNLQNSASVLSLNGKTLTLNGSIIGLGNLMGSETSNLIVETGSGANFNLRMNPTHQNTQSLNSYSQYRNSTITLTTPLFIKDVLNLSGTNSILSSNGNLTLLSTANSTSSVGFMGVNSDITGNVNVQSYFTGGQQLSKRGTRMISIPVLDNQASPNYIFEQIKDQMFFTGPGNTSNGFDLGGNASPNATTMVTQVESKMQGVYGFDLIEKILTRTIPAKAYFLFYRGDRTSKVYNKLNAPFADPENVTLTYKGIINKGTIQINATHTNNVGDNYNGICAIGNPYPSVLDFDNFLADNSARLEDILSIIKPDRTGQITKVGNVSTNDNFNVTGGSVAQSIRYIQPCQSFYVRVKNGQSGLLTFNESQKASSVTPVRLLSKRDRDGILNNTSSSSKVNQEIQSQSVLKMAINDGIINNETAIIFREDADENYTNEDAILLSNGIITCGTLTNDGINMAINLMPALKKSTTIKMMVNSETSNSDLKLIFSGLKAFTDNSIILRDKYLNVSTPINHSTNSYQFNIDKNINSSFGTERFELIIEPTKTLPLNLTNFFVENKGNSAFLKWQTEDLGKVLNFEIEKSLDGNNFYKIGEMKSIVENRLYTYEDKFPDKVAYYRIKQMDNNGNFLNSKILSYKTSLSDHPDKFSLYPNPVKDYFNLKSKDNYIHPLEINILDYNLQKMRTFIRNSNQEMQITIPDLSSGFYILQIRNQLTKEILFKTKFIKK
jgi:hypothetical protein